MIIKLGDYLIETDERQFILKKKEVVKESHLTKAENVGKEKLKDIGYYGSFESCLKNICTNVLLTNDDLNIIKSKLDEIEREIKALNNRLQVKVVRE